MNRTFRFRGAPVFILEGAAAFTMGGAVSAAREAALIPRKLRREGRGFSISNDLFNFCERNVVIRQIPYA